MTFQFDDRLLTTKEASQRTGMSKAWFEQQRWLGTGPTYIKVGRAIRYRMSVLDSWFSERQVTANTSSQ